MSPLSRIAKACGRRHVMSLWLSQAVILSWSACSLLMECSHSYRFERTADLCFGPNSQVLSLSAILGGESIRFLSTRVLFESFHFNPHAHAISSRLQITSSFSAWTSASSALFAPPHLPPVAPVCCHSNRQRQCRLIHLQSLLSCMSLRLRASTPEPGDALWVGEMPHALFYPWGSTIFYHPHKSSWDFSP